ncbi:MAG: addiction module toxin RelE [Paludibacter sp.]|nr:addiction module toxin RelE [Paludibacter sp.]
MKFKVTIEFEKSLKRLSKKYKSLKDDYIQFLNELEINPYIGDEIIENCRKARIAIKSKGKGKSGGGSVIFYFEIVNEEIILLYIYDKNEMDNVNDEFIRYLLESYK